MNADTERARPLRPGGDGLQTAGVHRSPSPQARNRRERSRLLAQRDRLGNRSKFAAAAIERAEQRIAALAVEVADVDRQLLELGAEVAT